MIQTYIPLYRKYRPQSFADVVGQTAVVQTLSNAIRLNQVAHAYLFCGPRGTGKTSTARILAKSLNCEQGPTVTPCQVCDSCTGILNGTALDVIEIDAASNNKVDDARDLIEGTQFAPLRGRYKVYIVDEVHMLTSQAFNALLKTLEEPPPSVVFIFATTEAHKVLPTIVSRCQRFDFSRITATDIRHRLADIAQRETIPVAEDALQLIARHARGGLRDAVGLLDQLSVLAKSQPGQTMGVADVQQFTGAMPEEVLLQLAEALARRDAAGLVQQLADLGQRGVDPNQILKELTEILRTLMLVRLLGEGALPLLDALTPESLPRWSEVAQAFPAEVLPLMLSRMAGVERMIRHSPQPVLWLEVGLMELAFRDDLDTVAGLTERVVQLEQRLAQGVPMAQAPLSPAPAMTAASLPPSPVAQAGPPRPAVAAPPMSTPERASPIQAPQPVAEPVAAASAPGSTLGLDWSAVVRAIASPATRALAQQQTHLAQVDGSRVVIGVNSTAILNVLKQPAKLIHLEKAVEAVLGFAPTLDLVVQEGRPAQTPQPEPSFEPAPQPLPPAAAPVPPLLTAPLPVTAAAPMAVAQPPEGPEPDLAPPPATMTSPVVEVPAASLSVHSGASNPLPEDWSEVRQYAVQLFQGQVLDPG